MHEPQLALAAQLTRLQVLAIGVAGLLVFGGVSWLIRYLECRKGVNALISLAVFGVIVAFLVFHIGWPR
jgi:hypothetical protein